jgi:cell division protein FtsB
MSLQPDRKFSSQKDFQLKVIFFVLFVVLAWILVEYTSLLYRSYQIEMKKTWFMEENERLMSNNRDLEKQYEYYKTDYFFRKEAKRKLNKKEPGEKVIIISGGDEKIRSENDWEITPNIPEKWWDYIFGTPETSALR